MKLAKRSTLLSSVSLGLLLAGAMLAMSQPVSAQYLISTKAGFINRVEGKVLIQRQDASDSERGRASLGTQMNDGDILLTPAHGRAEILLAFGSYLRLSENSEVRAIRTSMDEPRFALIRGSIIVETAQLTKGSAVQIDTPHGSIAIAKEGIQRIDTQADGTNVSVRQGEIVVGSIDSIASRNSTKVGKGKVVRLVGSPNSAPSTAPMVTKVNKDADADDFDVWSFNRAQTLMAANSHALRRSASLLSSSMSTGWYFDPFFNCYTFIPGRSMAFSPYGFPFFRRYSDYYYYFPYGYSYYGYPGYGWGGNGGNWGGGGNGGGGGASIPSRIVAGYDRAPVRREMEGRAVRAASSDSPYSSSSSDRGFSSGSSSSSSSVSAPSAPVSISASPSRGDSGASSSAGASRPGRP